MSKKLSIITINRNNAQGLEQTIQSVCCLNSNDYEYIIIDGASIDNSVDVIAKYADKITYWVSEPDTGIYNAMNKGIEKANGEYLLFLNSGDYLIKGINLNNIFETLISGEDLIYFNLNLIEPKSGEIKIKHFPDIIDFKYLVLDTLPHQATFIRRDKLIAYGFYSEKYTIISDWVYFLNSICLYNATYKYIPEVFSTFTLDGVSTLENNRIEILAQRRAYLEENYKPYLLLYDEWLYLKNEYNKLSNSKSYRIVRKIAKIKYKLLRACSKE